MRQKEAIIESYLYAGSGLCKECQNRVIDPEHDWHSCPSSRMSSILWTILLNVVNLTFNDLMTFNTFVLSRWRNESYLF